MAGNLYLDKKVSDLFAIMDQKITDGRRSPSDYKPFIECEKLLTTVAKKRTKLAQKENELQKLVAGKMTLRKNKMKPMMDQSPPPVAVR